MVQVPLSGPKSGPYQNPNETKRNETKRNETKRNETKRNETKRNETKRNEHTDFEVHTGSLPAQGEKAQLQRSAT